MRFAEGILFFLLWTNIPIYSCSIGCCTKSIDAVQISQDSIVRTITYTCPEFENKVDTILFSDFKRALSEYCDTNLHLFTAKVVNEGMCLGKLGIIHRIYILETNQILRNIKSLVRPEIEIYKPEFGKGCGKNNDLLGKTILCAFNDSFDPLEYYDLFLYNQCFIVKNDFIESSDYAGFKIPLKSIETIYRSQTSIKRNSLQSTLNSALNTDHSQWFDITGRRVAKSVRPLQSSGISPGVYISKSANSTMKTIFFKGNTSDK